MEYFFNFEKLAYCKKARSEGCILCKIAQKADDVESLVVHETENFIVSLNLYPYNPGHSLVFPKRHIVDIREITEQEHAEMQKLVDTILTILDKAMAPRGYNIGYNMGLVAGGSIEHLHLHIIPRFPNEIGIAELLGGKRVLVQDLLETQAMMRAAFSKQV